MQLLHYYRYFNPNHVKPPAYIYPSTQGINAFFLPLCRAVVATGLRSPAERMGGIRWQGEGTRGENVWRLISEHKVHKEVRTGGDSMSYSTRLTWGELSSLDWITWIPDRGQRSVCENRNCCFLASIFGHEDGIIGWSPRWKQQDDFAERNLCEWAVFRPNTQVEIRGIMGNSMEKMISGY